MLSDIDMLLMVEKGIRLGIRHAIHRYAKANNKYIKEYDKSKEMSYRKYCDVNNLYCWAMLEKLQEDAFEWVEHIPGFNEEFIKIYNDESDKGYFLEVIIQYPEKLQDLHKYLPFLPERMKTEKVQKLVANLYDKNKCYSHKKIKTSTNSCLVLKKVHRVIKFNQKAWLKQYVDMKTNLRKKAKNNFDKDFFKLVNNAVFAKTLENMTKQRDIKLVTAERRKNYLASEPNYHTTKFSMENLLAIEIWKTQILMNKAVYLGLSVLDLSKTVVYELGYMDTDGFIIHVKTNDIYKNLAEDIKTRFNTKNFVGLMKVN